MELKEARTHIEILAGSGIYIGDGVYMSHDGYQIWLKTPEGNRIALDPGVQDVLMKEIKKVQECERVIRQHYAKQGEQR